MNLVCRHVKLVDKISLACKYFAIHKRLQKIIVDEQLARYKLSFLEALVTSKEKQVNNL